MNTVLAKEGRRGQRETRGRPEGNQLEAEQKPTELAVSTFSKLEEGWARVLRSHSVPSLCLSLLMFLRERKGQISLQVILRGESHYNIFPIPSIATSDAHTDPSVQVDSQCG